MRCQKQWEQATARVPLLPNHRQHNQLWQGSDGVLREMQTKSEWLSTPSSQRGHLCSDHTLP